MDVCCKRYAFGPAKNFNVLEVVIKEGCVVNIEGAGNK